MCVCETQLNSIKLDFEFQILNMSSIRQVARATRTRSTQVRTRVLTEQIRELFN